MMGATLAFSHRPQSRWRRVGIALIVVPAALIALLAVHFFLAESQVPKPHAVSSSTVGSPILSAVQGDSALSDVCIETCGPVHDLVAVACVLALLVSAFFILFHFLRLDLESPRPVFQSVMQRLFVQVPASRPSLLILSISRT